MNGYFMQQSGKCTVFTVSKLFINNRQEKGGMKWKKNG